ncbi:ABC transporter ATP-binding protein [Halobacteriales archaeon SW_7_68_16]|nr:MAG: ABC transporter ATP-binding protein [Halobacteriales archaeon SW_7_68_16]
MDPAVEIRGVRKRYGDMTALRGVDLTVGSGEVVALIGPNGAGKTTLVRAITGTTDYDGTVRVFGASPRAVDPGRIGLLPQSFRPPERLTPRELVRAYAGLYDTAASPESVLAAVGLDDDADRRYGTLSGGQRRRTCLGLALVNDPDLLVVDEPTTGIDPAGRRRVRERLRSLADEGTTILLTTHDMDEAQRVADRVGLLADGDLVATGSPRSLVDTHAGPSRVVVDLDAGADGAGGSRTRQLETALADAPGEVTVADGTVVVGGVEPAAIGAIVDVVEAAGIDYSGLRWEEPDLEDAYVAITGDGREPTAGTDARTTAVPGGIDGSREGRRADGARGGERS